MGDDPYDDESMVYQNEMFDEEPVSFENEDSMQYEYMNASNSDPGGMYIFSCRPSAAAALGTAYFFSFLLSSGLLLQWAM